jgi:Family of unknown function (DUF6886)
MRPGPGEVLHFSEDPGITRFVPHVAATAQRREAYVWAVDAARAPDYWFPRQCPRAMAWLVPRTTSADRDLVLGPAGSAQPGASLRARAGGALVAQRMARTMVWPAGRTSAASVTGRYGTRSGIRAHRGRVETAAAASTP